MERNELTSLTLNQLMEACFQLTSCLAKNPEKLLHSQADYWQAYMASCQNYGLTELSQPSQGAQDKRFQHPAWVDNLSLNFIKQTYLLLSQHIDTFVTSASKDEDRKVAQQIKFYTQQFINASSPTNFPHLNPEVLATTLETNGINLLTGIQRFLKDLEQGKGQLTLPVAESDSFKLGENIACTPGEVIYQNDLIQLLYYTPQTQTVYQIPLLMIPPWINKYYILDLQPENSLVKWLVGKGFGVYMISWINPTRSQENKEFSDYMVEGPLSALKIIKQITGKKKVNVLGYCIGGTLAACMLAYLTKLNDTSIQSATFLTTLLDFSEPGELGIFMDEKQISLLEKNMTDKGYLDGRIMATVFNVLRANDLIWAAFVNHYLMGIKPKPFDLLYWNADSTHIPAKVHSFYLRNMYLNNYLIQPNKMTMLNVPLDLTHIKVPAYFLAAQDDHIAPWKSCYVSSTFYGGPVKFVLTTSGHVAGVINPPNKHKYHYYTNNKNPITGDDYLSSAHFHEGSWWNDWIQWLEHYSGRKQSPNRIKVSAHPHSEKAPGRFVKVRLDDLE